MPCRALRWSSDRTQEVRSSPQLFVSHITPHGAVSADSISRGVVETIRRAGPGALHEGPVRAMTLEL